MRKKTFEVEENIHDFHMVMTVELKSKIRDLSEKLNKSMSSTAIYIIERSLSFFKIKRFESEESPVFSKYRNIFWKKHLHIYLDKTTYRKIKHLCDTHMAFSIGIVIRWLFNYYFNKLYDEKTNKEKKKEIAKKNNEVKNYEEKIKTWGKNITDKQLSGSYYYQLTFNDKFSIIGFNFLDKNLKFT